ncbi:hypothetical protein [Caulobacter endophyticus]|uniref:hypothetical protein n=1 Tax=Caulobacter endophyticus TaxID=2172652 RepID=UPI00240EA948|nr:hypothetical protein [Caulobacter endophyticus]MDG2527646.1 hypothetical protein [Caulobacter endophyticus]
MAQTFEDALETVLAWLETPPPSGTPEEARFLAAIERVLAEPDGSEASAEQAAAIDDIVRVDDDLRQRLAKLANARRNPFGDHPDGIGPTLGMDLGAPKAD